MLFHLEEAHNILLVLNYDSQIFEIQKSPKWCRKSSNTEKAKVRNHEIESNGIKEKEIGPFYCTLYTLKA